MKKKTVVISFVLLFCIMLALPVHAAEHPSRVVDRADLLTQREETDLLNVLDEISERQQVDIVVVTVDSLNGKSAMAYADDFYDDNGYGFGADHDGILLLVSMEKRDYWITTTGYGISAFTDAGIDYMEEMFVPALSDGAYARAFETYAELCDDFLTQAKTGRPYDRGNLPKAPFNVFGSIVISLIVGFVIAFLVMNTMKNELKTVRAQVAANNYVKKNSLNVTVKRDLFLYSTMRRTPRPKNTSSGGGSRTHSSSSGRSHGGGGGKF